MRIDAHQHFWRYDPAEYGWIGEEMAALRRDFMPDDLREAAGDLAPDATVAVQARQSLEETDWLLDLAEADLLVGGVVGWFPLTDTRVEEALEVRAPRQRLRGVRHVLHDEPDDRYMLRDDFNRGLSLLLRHELAYDILIFERHLPHAIEMVDRHPSQPFVVDHLAKPKVRAGNLEPWRENLRELARRPNVACKLSGLVTEADWARWTPEKLQPWFDAALEAFGPARLMFGSDWPVCLVAADYRRWHAVVTTWLARCSDAERERVMGGTAAEVYRLDAPKTSPDPSPAMPPGATS